MKIPQEVRDQFKDFGYLLTGYLVVCLLIYVSYKINNTNETVGIIFTSLTGVLVLYPLGKNIAKLIKNIVVKLR